MYNLQQQFAAATQVVRLFHHFSYWHEKASRITFLMERLQDAKLLAQTKDGSTAAVLC
jgi:hypothetical protein